MVTWRTWILVVSITVLPFAERQTARCQTIAARDIDFLNSLGVNTHVQHRQDAAKLSALLRFLGVRNVREALDRNYDITGLLLLHRQAGVLVDLSPGSGVRDEDLPETLSTARRMVAAGALLAVEGPNEPNNFGGITYQGATGGGSQSWMPVAAFQRDLYRAVKSDAILRRYPVFDLSEGGAEIDNVGLQFLTIPKAADTKMAAGTRFADSANCHNYAPYAGNKGLEDNMAWNAADPVLYNARWDGLVGNYGITWRHKFKGYPSKALQSLPRVTTETGWPTGAGQLTEDQQGKLYLNIYLSQFKRSWRYTFIYEMMDDPDGAWGFYKSDYATARPAAVYLHNLVSILADKGRSARQGQLDYSITAEPSTVHDLLLQKSDRTFELIVWGEQVRGTHNVTVDLGRTFATIRIYDPTIGSYPTRVVGRKAKIRLAVTSTGAGRD
jgi:hypothetical protein